MKYEYNLILRVLILIILPIKLFYLTFKPLTIYPVYLFFKVINYSPIIKNDLLTIKGIEVVFVSSCIAASAYYLLLILIMLTKDINLKTRLKMFLIGSLSILIANIIRIIILIFILINYGLNWFETFHLFLWKFVATIYVIAVWLLLTHYYKINSIPIYSDLKHLIDNSLLKKRK